MQYRKIISATAAVLAVVAMLAGCANTGAKTDITLGKAVQGKLNGEINISGTLAPTQSAAVSTQIAGLITAVPVKEGSIVQKGQLLVQLDSRDSQAQLAKSQTKISQTQFMIEQAQTGIGQAQTGIEQAKAALDDAARNLDRYNQLFAAGGASQSQLDAYKTAWTNAKAAWTNAKAARTNAKLNYDSVAKGTMPSAQEDAKIAALTLDKSRIISPIDGMVVAVSANAGENVLPGTALVTVVNAGVFELSGNIGEEEVSGIAVGQKCSVAADAVPGKNFPAQVSFVSPISLASGSSFPVRLQIANSGGMLRAGMNAAAAIQVSQTGLIVPATAVFEENGKSYIFVDNNGKASKTAVMTGLRTGRKTVVLSGITEKTSIVVKGADSLLEGDKLK